MSTYICWPEKRWLSDVQVETWYADAIANNMVKIGQNRAKTIKDMVDVLEDIGYITRGLPPGGA
jgi:hypothetical protein